MRAAIVVAVALAGCAELPEIAERECGNHVVEPGNGEECDGVAGCGDPDGPNGCGWVCDAQACPTGYACGADQRCRLPTETFVATSAQQMATFAVSAADMDGDGAADLMGYDSRGLVTRFGDWDGALDASTRIPLPLATAASCTADLDGNGVRDLALPIGEIGFGLFVGDGARGLTPVSQSAIKFGGDEDVCAPILATNVATVPGGEPRLIFAMGGRDLAFLDDPDACTGQADCGITVAGGAMLDGVIPHAVLGYGAAAGVHAGEQFTIGVAGAGTVSVWGETLGALRPKRVALYNLPEPMGEGGHVRFAQLNADGCPDLLIDTGTSLRIAYATTSLGACTGLSPTLTTAVYPDGTLIGVGDTDGDGVDELLAALFDDTAGDTFWVIAAYAPTTPGQWSIRGLVLSAERPKSAVTLDYDRDGYPDLVATFDGLSTVDFFLNYLGQGYSRFPVDVGGHPRTPHVGDFDGDLHDDVVFTVPDEADPEGRDAVQILYGDPGGRPIGPQYLGAFVSDALPDPLEGGLQPFADSVIVVSNHVADPATCDRRMSILIGDTSRQLVSPYVLTLDDPDLGIVPVTPLGIADVSVPGGPARTLAVGITAPAVADPAVALAVLRFDDGEFTVEPGLHAQFAFDAVPPEILAGARWVSGDLGADGVAEAIAVSGEHGVLVHLDGAVTAERFALGPELADPSWIDLVDVDLDGDLDLVGAAGSAIQVANEALGAASYFWVMRNDGGALDTEDPDVLAMPDGLFCYDAATIHTSIDGAPQLAALCYVGATGTFAVVISGYAAGAAAVASPRVIAIDGAPAQLEIADVTGDGLDDLALFTDSAVSIYRQCRTDEVCLSAEAL